MIARLRLVTLFLCPLFFPAIADAQAPRVVSLESLLEEMTDYDSIARWPDPEFKCLQASSHDRATVAPDQPGWFANDDHTCFIRTEDIQGRKEQVMMDAAGPGCIVRFWLTTIRNKKGTLRIYLDRNTEPALTFPPYDLLAGGLRLTAPLAQPHPGYSPTENGGNTLMLPIPYAEHCKVTWEEGGEGPRYYQINHRSYQPGTRVETVTPASLEQARPMMEKVSKALLAPPPAAEGRRLSLDRTIMAGESAAIDLPAGPAAVRQFEFRLATDDPAKLEAALRSTIVRFSFDGKETVWCPAGDFFGSGVGVNPLASWYRTVRGDGSMVCRWVMPYSENGTLTLTNTGNAGVRISATS